MRFTCARSPLAEIAGLVGQAVASKSTKRIFECIRIRAGKEGLELAGTDLEVGVRRRLTEGFDLGAEGEAVVPASLFVAILREIGDERVAISVARRKLTLEADGGVFDLECEDPAEFPEIPGFPEEATGRIAAADLRALVRKTSFAAGREAARFVLNGVQVTVQAESIHFVATDGRRLAMLTRPLEPVGDAASKGKSAVLGVKGLHHFERACAGVEGTVELALESRFAALRTPEGEVTVRVMDGTFPDYEQIVPKEGSGVAQIPVGGFALRLRQVEKFASVESRAVVLEVKPGALAISARGGDGQAQVQLGITYKGPEEKVGFNPVFLLDALKVVDGEEITLTLGGRNAAAKMTDAAGFVYVIMPVLID